jgi:hypothetical protein
MEFQKICEKVNISLEDGEKVRQNMERKLEQHLKEPYSSYLIKEKTKEEWVLLGVLVRDFCRGLPNDPLSIFLSSCLLPSFYNELKKHKHNLEILQEISIKEQINPRVWTLKHLNPNVVINEETTINKLHQLQQNESLTTKCDIGINKDKTFDLIKDGKVIGNKQGLFLGSLVLGNKTAIWKWLTTIGPLPPIDIDFVSPYLPDRFCHDKLNLDNKRLWFLLSLLALIFDLNEVQVIKVETGNNVKLCVGFK